MVLLERKEREEYVKVSINRGVSKEN